MGTSGVFVRKATGLVRQVSTVDLIVYNVGSGSIGIGVATILLYVNALWYPGWSYWLAFFLVLIGALFQGLIYWMFVTIYPRSGGDYVYLSRNLLPSWGFAMNFIFIFWMIYYMGWSAGAFSHLGVAPLLLMIGSMTNNPSMVETSTAFSSPVGFFITGSVVLWIFAAMAYRSMKIMFRSIMVLFVLGMIAVFLCVGVLATTSQPTFVQAFNQYAAPFTTEANPYDAVIAKAQEFGYQTNQAFSFASTINSLGWVFGLVLGYTVMSAAFAGEIKRVERASIIGIIGAALIIAAFNAVLCELAVKAMGYDFLNSVSVLFWYDPQAVPLPTIPYVQIFISILTNPYVAGMILIGFIAWAVYWVPTVMVFSSRSFFAYSVDMLLPESVSSVSKGYHTPVVAITLVVVLAEIMLALYAFTPYMAWLVGIMGSVPTFFFVGIAGIIFPFTKKDLYKRSPIKREIAGVPVMSIVGLIDAVFMAFLMYQYATDSYMGVNTVYGLSMVAGVVIFALVWFYVARAIRKRQGIDIDLAYREVPIE